MPQHEDEEVELADVINELTRHLREVIQAECGLIQLEISGLRTQIDTMSGLIDKLTEENRALRARPRTPVTVPPLPPPPSTVIPPPRPKRKRTGPQTPHQPMKVQKDTSPIRAIGPPETAQVETKPAQPAEPATSAPEAPPRETDEGWKKVERKRKRRGTEKKGKNGKQEHNAPWANTARGRGGGIHFTAFLGGYGGYTCERPRKPRRKPSGKREGGTGAAERGGGGAGGGVSGQGGGGGAGPGGGADVRMSGGG